MSGRLYVGLMPWVVFGVADRIHGPGTGWAALAAAVCAVVLLGVSWWSPAQRVTRLEIVASAGFTALAAVGLAGSGGWLLEPAAGRVVAAVGLASVLLSSLLGTPVADVCARDAVPARARSSPAYRKLVVSVTTTWGLCALVVAVACAGGLVASSPLATTIVDWLLPLGAVLVAVKLTRVAWLAFLEDGEAVHGDEGVLRAALDATALGLRPGSPRRAALRLVERDDRA